MSKDNATAAMLMAIIAVRQNVYDRTQAPNANTNGGDASRVGIFGKGSQTGVSLVLPTNHYLV